MPVARPEPSHESRVIAHVDLDCFYVQVEQRKHPELRGRPTGVVQYNPWKGGALIAVGYEARKYGVKRSMRGDEAKAVCPDIQLVQVPVAHGKANLSSYRDAGSEVVAILARRGKCERASIDEVYLDITEASAALLRQESPCARAWFPEEVLQTHILGILEDGNGRSNAVGQWLCRSDADQRDKLLACGAIIIAELRMIVLKETQFTCSAGIAHNKMLAKLASGMHKPAQQTIIPSFSVYDLLASLPLKKMNQLGGKLGESLQADLGVQNVGDLLPFSESRLQELYGFNTGTWLWQIARGMSGDQVKVRTLPKSHSCGKTFPGPQALTSWPSVKYWLGELADELQERLDADFEQNHRTAHLLTLHASANLIYKVNQERKFPSKSCSLRYGKEKIAQDAMQLFERALNEFCAIYGLSNGKRKSTDSSNWAITALFLGAFNIFANTHRVNSITDFFSLTISNTESNCLSSTSTSPPASTLWVSSFSENAVQSSDYKIETDDVAYGTSRLFSINESPCEYSSNRASIHTAWYTSNSKAETNDLPNQSEKNESILPLVTVGNDHDCTYVSYRSELLETSEETVGVEQPSMQTCRAFSLEKMPAQQNNKTCQQQACVPEELCKQNRQICGRASSSFGDACNLGPSKFCSMPKAWDGFLCMEDSQQSPIHSNHVYSSNGTMATEHPVSNSAELCKLAIQCSPVEVVMGHDCDTRAAIGNKLETTKMNLQCLQETGNIVIESHGTCSGDNDVKFPGQNFISRERIPVVGNSQSPSLVRLEDLWQHRKEDTIQTTNILQNRHSCYKPGDIDMDVLLELPEEIQQEICNTLCLKRPRIGKRSTIGDFFKSSAFS